MKLLYEYYGMQIAILSSFRKVNFLQFFRQKIYAASFLSRAARAAIYGPLGTHDARDQRSNRKRTESRQRATREAKLLEYFVFYDSIGNIMRNKTEG